MFCLRVDDDKPSNVCFHFIDFRLKRARLSSSFFFLLLILSNGHERSINHRESAARCLAAQKLVSLMIFGGRTKGKEYFISEEACWEAYSRKSNLVSLARERASCSIDHGTFESPLPPPDSFLSLPLSLSRPDQWRCCCCGS